MFKSESLSLIWFGFTPLESPAIYGGDDINKASRRVESTTIHYRKGGVKPPSFLTGFTSNLNLNLLLLVFFLLILQSLDPFL
jgi:hypothetical protein